MTAGRTWTLPLLGVQRHLSLNQRLHWAERNRRSQIIKDAAIVAARIAKLPTLQRAHIVLHVVPRTRHRRDLDNLVATLKPAIDGLVAARVLEDDDSTHVTSAVVIERPEPVARYFLTVEAARGE